MRKIFILAGTISLFVIAALVYFYSRRQESSKERAHRPAVVDLSKYPGSTGHVTFTPETVTIDLDTVVKDLRGVNLERSVLLFDNSSEEAKKLVPGTVLLIPSVTALKVTKVVPIESRIAVQTSDAALTDVIKEGVLHWDLPVNFQSLVASPNPDSLFLSRPGNAFGASRPWFPIALGVVHADSGSGCRLSGKLSDWTYNLQCSPEADRLNFDLDLKKRLAGDKTSGASVEITGTGYVQNFQSSLDMNIQDSVLQSLLYTNKNLNGAINFTWTAATEVTGPITGDHKLKLPAMMKFPVEFFGIPFVVQLSGALLFKPGFTGKSEIAIGKFRVEYNGVQGLSVKGGNINQSGEVHGKLAILEAPSFAALGGMGFIAGLAFPRVELKLAGLSDFADILPEGLGDALKKVGGVLGTVGTAIGLSLPATITDPLKSDAAAYVEVVTVTSLVKAGTLTSLGVPCQDVQLIVTGKAGVTLKLLGRSLLPASGDPSVELFRHGETQSTGTCGHARS